MRKAILIVDDDKQFCRVIRQFCEDMGCFNNILFAHDGVVAAIKLKNQKFDVVILDINLPKRTGVDVLKEMSEDKYSINKASNVVVVSGLLEKETIAKILMLNCRNFLVKPFSEEHLKEKVFKIIHG